VSPNDPCGATGVAVGETLGHVLAATSHSVTRGSRTTLRRMSIELPETVQARVESEQVVWLTVTADDGRPLPTPVWFVVDDDGDFVVYTAATAPKVAALRARPKVSLNFNTDPMGGSVAVLSGTAQVVAEAPAPTRWPGYLDKYAGGIDYLGMTQESFDEAYVQQLRITPTSVRAF
jgi:PPOX class probable F420-dependent enzyme